MGQYTERLTEVRDNLHKALSILNMLDSSNATHYKADDLANTTWILKDLLTTAKKALAEIEEPSVCV